MNFNSKTMLFLAVFGFCGSLYAAEKRIDKVNIIDTENVYESVKKLVDEGVDVNLVKDLFGRTMLTEVIDIATKSNDLIKKEKRAFSDADDSEVSLKYEYEVNIAKQESRRIDAIKAIYLLLVRGADINIMDNLGWTPITFAEWKDDQEILNIFNKFKKIRKRKIEEHCIPVLAEIISEY